jgi:PST family polysaccharide transporter
MSSYVVPLVLIPYLARILGASGWGLVAFAQALGGYVGMVVEFGFYLSANREVARCRDDREKRGEILAGVLGARVILCFVCVGAALLARMWIPIFIAQPKLFWAGMFWGATQGFGMSWFFQGLERMGLVAALETPSQILSIIAIFVFVRRPEQAWLVLLIQGLAYATPAAIELVLAYTEARLRRPTWRLIRESLLVGWNMFLYRGTLEGYTRANALILGLFVSPQAVGYYAAAEKISRASYRILNPVTQAVFPRMSYLVEHARERAQKLARIGVLLVGAGGLALALFLFLAAPWIVRIVLGPAFGPAVPLLRILALIPALVAIWQAYGTQWMLPLGLDRPFTAIMILAGVTNVGLAFVFVPRFETTGMAWTAVAAEAVLALGYYTVVRVRRLDPLSSIATEDPVPTSTTT